MRPAECLVGLDLPDGWHVDSIIYRPPTSTGGKFSVGYHVTNADGKNAYLKALDFSSAFNEPDPPRALQPMVSAYNFERDLLAKCRERKLRRVVIPLSDGTVQAPGNFGQLGKVSYIIFELAAGDRALFCARSARHPRCWFFSYRRCLWENNAGAGH